MQPLPETRAAVEQLNALVDGLDLLQGIGILSDVATALVPSVVGVSLTVVVDGDPFTVTSTSDAMGVLDASQYLDGGPCLEAAELEAGVVNVDDVLDEERWQLYRHATSAHGVRASLSLPLGGAGGRTPGAINLYSSEAGAFRGKEQLLAEVFQTPADEFVTNADLSFMTRDLARRLPEDLAAKAKLDRAAGMLVGLLGWPVDEARERLRSAADQARTPLDQVVELIVALGDAQPS